jgi:hypothetical protein
MFVRWKYGERRSSEQGLPYRCKRAVLVESVRTERGPRSQHLCYLGSVCEWFDPQQGDRVRALDDPGQFWAVAERNLDKAGIAGAERERIIATLESAVPRPDSSLPENPFGRIPARTRRSVIRWLLREDRRTSGPARLHEEAE